MTSPKDVVTFWTEAGPDAWFKKNDAFDAAIRARFEATHHAAARGELEAWGETHESALALLILLDQFPRNLYRGSAHAFATDGLAQAIARAALDAGHDRATDTPLRMFFYLPLEHAEDLGLQARSVALFESLGDEGYAKYARLHRDIIARFRRFPHRNVVLGRESTAEEIAFLAGGGFAG